MTAERPPVDVPGRADERWTVPGNLTPEDPWRSVFGWQWEPGPSALCIGINPSFGTERKPDATMLSLRGVLRFNSFCGYLLGNHFARRSKDPRALLAGPNAYDHIGADNDNHLRSMIGAVDVLIACWGVVPHPRLNERVMEVEGLLRASGKPLKCFGLTKAGHPRHPLYLPHRTPLEDYRP